MLDDDCKLRSFGPVDVGGGVAKKTFELVTRGFLAIVAAMFSLEIDRPERVKNLLPPM